MSTPISMNYHPRYKDLFIITTRTIVDHIDSTNLDSSTTLVITSDNIFKRPKSDNVKYEKKVEIVYNVVTGLSYSTTSYNPI